MPTGDYCPCCCRKGISVVEHERHVLFDGAELQKERNRLRAERNALRAALKKEVSNHTITANLMLKATKRAEDLKDELEEAESELNLLADYFWLEDNTEGRCGDLNRDSTVTTAIRVMRKRKSELDDIASTLAQINGDLSAHTPKTELSRQIQDIAKYGGK